MNNNLQQLLTEYEQTRLENIRKLDLRKKELYSRIPRLEEIEKNLNLISIKLAKSNLFPETAKNNEDLKKEQEALKKEREELLKKDGKDLSFLNVEYNCNICKDTGYIINNSRTEMCKCLKQKLFDLEYNQANMGNVNKHTFENLNFNLFSDKVNIEKYGLNISPRENMKNIVDSCKKFVENMSNPAGKNLLFSGSTGLGKTYLSNAIVTECLNNGYTVLYQTAPVMLDTLISKMFKNDLDFSENLLNVDLLVIDDLGTETMNSMKFTELYKIINTRLLNPNGKTTKTIISTNLDLQGLYNTYDERLVSRFIGHYDIYRFFGDDIRFKI